MVIVAYDLMVAVTATIAIGSVTEVVFRIPRNPAILCGGGIVIVYSVIGGMWSLTLTDIIQFVIKTVGIFLVLLPLSIDGAGGPGAHAGGAAGGLFDLGHIGLDTILTYFLLYFFGALIGQDIWQRVFTAQRDGGALRRAWRRRLLHALRRRCADRRGGAGPTGPGGAGERLRRDHPARYWRRPARPGGGGRAVGDHVHRQRGCLLAAATDV